MASIIKLKRSTTPGAVPADSSLAAGELAINLSDKKLYSSSDGTNIITISGDQYNFSSLANTSHSVNGADLVLSVDNTALSNDVITLLGTANEVTVTRNANGSITFGLPDDVTVSGGLTVVGSSALNGVTATTVQANGTLDVTGLSSLDGGVDVNSNFTVDASGNVDAVGTLNVDGATTLNGLTVTTLTANGNVGIGGDLSVDGSLNVLGDLTYISTSTVSADDSMLKLAANNAADIVDIGVYGMYVDGATSKYAGWFRDATDGIFKYYTASESEPTTTVDTGATGYTLGQVDAIIDGGTY
jgi:hypothetical protein